MIALKVIIVSRSWPSHEKSGVSLAAHQHAQILLDEGCDVSIVGSSITVLKETLNATNKFHVESSGSGTIYSKSRVNKPLLHEIFESIKPDLVIVEGWQTSLTDAAIDIASGRKLPLMVISHGISLHPFSNSLFDIARSFFWAPYRLRLKKRISNINALTSLDLDSKSPRFYDRDLANQLNVPVFNLVNSPINWRSNINDKSQRKKQIIVVGYFSYIKNQLAAIGMLAELPEDLKLVFVGPKKGSYYEKCVQLVVSKGLCSRVLFYDDNECNLAEEISDSLVMLCTSITEVLPISILEAMASRTPYVAPEIGAIPSLRSGVIVNDIDSQKDAIERLINDENYWNEISNKGAAEYEARFTLKNVSNQLMNAVKTLCMQKSTND